MIKIERKEGWILNPNDKLVNAILKRCEKNDGLCPCHHDTPNYEGKDLHCPCTDYAMQGECACGLYIKEEAYWTKKFSSIKHDFVRKIKGLRLLWKKKKD